MKRIQKLCAFFMAFSSAITAISPFKICAAEEAFSIADAVRLQQYLLGETADVPVVYDVNADGKLNAVDLTLMKRQLMPVWTAADYAAICINEICASNDGCLTDSAGRTPDWIELYNSGAKTLPLSGVGLTNGSKNLFKFIFPQDAVLPPHGYLVVLCNKSVAFAEGEYRAAFNVSVSGGDVLTLTQPAFGTLDAVTLPEMATDITYGRVTDGAAAFARLMPTPGASNDNAARSGFVTQPEFSVPAGFYDTAFSLTLSAEPSCPIYYTLDGSDPTTSETAQRYAGAINIYDNTSDPNVYSAVEGIDFEEPVYTVPTEPVEKGMVIRAAAADGNGNYSKVVTNTYFVGKTKEYCRAMKVISVTSDPDALFNKEIGIYVNAGNDYTQTTGRASERPCNIQVFDAGKAVYSEDVGMRLTGSASKKYAQKSMTFYARSDYGAKKMKYDFFDGAAVDTDGARITEFDKLTLRNGGQDYKHLHIRDDIAQELAADMRFAKQAKAPCIVFLDGEFWGYYTMQEKIDEEYLESHFQISEYNIDLIDYEDVNLPENLRQTEGMYADYRNLFTFLQNADLTNPEIYAEICAQIDIDSLIDYIILESYICNWDSCINVNNLRLWRSKTIDNDNPYADGKWRPILFDTDLSAAIPWDFDSVRFVTYSFDYLNQMNDTAAPTALPKLFYALMKNDTFSAAFYQRYTELLRTNFSEDSASAAIDKWVNRTKAAVIDTYVRFGLVTNYDTSEKLLRHFYENRAAWALHQLKLLCGIPDDWDDADIPDIDPLSCGLCMTYAYDTVGGIGTLELAEDGTAKINAEQIGEHSIFVYPVIQSKLRLDQTYTLQFTVSAESAFSFTAEVLLENYTSVFSEEITAGASEKTYTFRFQPPADAFGANPNGAYAANLVFMLRSIGTMQLSDVSME